MLPARTDLLMPVRPGRWIARPVVSALIDSGWDGNLFVSTVFAHNLPMTRNHLKSYPATDLCLMMDNDLLLPTGSLLAMQQKLDHDPGLAAIALRKTEPDQDKLHLRGQPGQVQDGVEYAGHVDLSCVLWRRPALQQLHFRYQDDTCDCMVALADLNQLGYRFGFLAGPVCQQVIGADPQREAALERQREDAQAFLQTMGDRSGHPHLNRG